MDSAFLKALAQARPDPGGGAAAAHSAALGLALLEKVVQLEQRRRFPEEDAGPFWADLLAQVRLVAAGAPAVAGRGCRGLFPVYPGPRPRRPQRPGRGPRRGGGLPPEDHAAGPGGLGLALPRVGPGAGPTSYPTCWWPASCWAPRFGGRTTSPGPTCPSWARTPRRAVWAANLTHTLAALESEFQQVRAGLLARKPCP